MEDMQKSPEEKIADEEIAYREELISRACKGIKCSPEERLWLETHAVYNMWLKYPYYNRVLEKVKEKTWYSLIVTVESYSYDDMIHPVISVPAGKGKIIADFEVTDYNGKVSLGKPVKMLGLFCEEPKINAPQKVRYYSDLGLLFIFYRCKYFDENQHLQIVQASNTGSPVFALKREVIGENKVRYYCKSPKDDSFDAMVFTVEWVEE